MVNFKNLIALVITSLAALSVVAVAIDSTWYDAHATFYGDIYISERAGGYGDLFKQGYGLNTAALSTALFNKGLTCGACFEIYCNSPQWCKKGSITITATNFCPPSDKPSTAGGWCNPPLQHFDLSEKMFLQIAKYKAGIVPVKYRRVLCYKQGGVQFQIGGNPNWLLVLPFNVAGAGDIVDMKVKGSSTGWMQMTRN
ncbi:hypothetical protein ACFE04_013172 [Oxalis oulophora]